MRQETLKAASLLLNGKEIDENQVAVSVDQTKKADVKISLKNLDYGTHYQLSLKADSTWADRFDRKQTFDPISFKTCGRYL